jgi:hypothetical protein
MAANHATRTRHAAKTNDALDSAVQSVRLPAESAARSLREYAREHPEAAALWCLAIGFVLGWRMKPW